MRWYLCFLLGVTVGCSSVPSSSRLSDSTYEQNRSIATVSTAELRTLTPNSTTEELLRYALKKNAGVRSSFYRWKAALKKVAQAGVLPDPKFTFGYFIDQVETRVGPQEYKAGIRQTFPWFGKLQLREDAAAMEALAAGQAFVNTRNRLAFQFKLAYADWYFLEQSIRVTSENIKLIGELLAIVKSRYATGKAGYPDLIRLQISLSKQKNRLDNFVDYRAPVSARVYTLLQHELGVVLNPPQAIPTAFSTDKTREVLYAESRRNNPTLKQIDFLIEKALISEKLADKQFYPDVSVGVDYVETGVASMSGVRDSGKDPVMAVVTMNLPIWRDKYRAAAEEAQARAKALKYSRNTKEKLLEVGIAEAIYKIKFNDRQQKLYRENIIPQSRRLLQALKSSYSSGRASYVALVDAQQNLLKFELKYEEAVLKRYKAGAKLQFILGQ